MAELEGVEPEAAELEDTELDAGEGLAAVLGAVEAAPLALDDLLSTVFACVSDVFESVIPDPVALEPVVLEPVVLAPETLESALLEFDELAVVELFPRRRERLFLALL